MPIGIRLGPRIGPRLGLRIGSPPGGTDPMAGVARDAASGIYVPATGGQWTTTLSVVGIGSGNPSLLWLLQEAAGNVADSIGTFTGTVTGSPTYQTAVTGWTRKAITFGDGATARFTNGDAGLPDILTTSMLVYAVCTCPGSNPAGIRNVIEAGTAGANRAAAEFLTTGPFRALSTSTNAANGTTTMADGGVHPVVLRVNRTASTMTVFNNADKMVPAFGAGMTGKFLNIGGVAAGQAAFAGGYLYCAAFFGAAAEITDAQVKSLLQRLGWTIGWS